MGKREFIDIDNALKAVDDRVEELRKDKQFRYSKQIDVMGVKNHFPDYPIITEQDIVKPYLKKLSNEVKNHAVEFELFGISDDYISIGILQGIIIRLLSEQGDTNDKDKI